MLIHFYSYFQNVAKDLRSEIYKLQVECDRLTEKIDRHGDSRSTKFFLSTYFIYNYIFN